MGGRRDVILSNLFSLQHATFSFNYIYRVGKDAGMMMINGHGLNSL